MANITTIPATAPFLDSLVSAILNGDLPQKGGEKPAPEQLASYTLLLPTRRACRVCGEAFLRRSGQSSIILPKIRPIGDGNEDESLIHDALREPQGADGSLLNMNPAISKLERHLILTRFIIAWLVKPGHEKYKAPFLQEAAGQKATPASASLLAHELAKLIDNAATEGVDLNDLENLVQAEFSDHWQQTLDFLKIVTEQWPAYLDNTDQMDIAIRRNLLLEKEANRLIGNPPKGPVIIAGSTGSIPAAAKLMAAVLACENGALVLPALDHHLEDEDFKELAENHPEHPQHGLANLLTALNVPRSAVKELPGTAPILEEEVFINFLSESLRPASSAEKWQAYSTEIAKDKTRKQALASAFRHHSLTVTRDEQEEAETIALILRRTAEQEGRSAALITPDRLLARRVATRLEAWGIRVDDSGGRPLVKTMPGAFFNLISDVMAQDYAPAPLLALLKHPLTSLGFEKGAARLAARALEIAALRRPWRGGGLQGLVKTFQQSRDDIKTGQTRNPAIARLGKEEWLAAETLLTRLETAFAPLAAQQQKATSAPLAAFLKAHIETAENLNADAEGAPKNLWQGAAGEHLAKLLAEIINTEESLPPPVAAAEYPDFFKSLLAGETIRPLTPVHPRLFIWGPFEARLQQPDVVILGGLNEGTWPGTSKVSPWLSRPMCRQLGLPEPEAQIGHSANDFASLLCAKEVHLTRAAKSGGVETVASRWLQRMNALLSGAGLEHLLEPDPAEPFAQWADHRNQITPEAPLKSPAPTPPVSARPRRLSVTRIEDWIANPYSIYARYILRLNPLDPIGSPPTPAVKGEIIHKALEKFTEQHPVTLPEDPAAELIKIGKELMQKWAMHPEIEAFWLPRFIRFAGWFAATEPARRTNLARIWTEQQGEIVYKAPAGPFTLTARADRIDEKKGGSFHIYDYKTGASPAMKKIETRYKPQLPLEAAILQKGGFAALGKGPVEKVCYIEAKGGEPPGESKPLDKNLEAIIAETEAKLEQLIAGFDQEETPYRALRRKDFKGDYVYDDFAHLARIDEWGAATGEDE